MYYTNYEDRRNYRKDYRKEEKYIFYISSIGNNADEILRTMLDRLYLSNPRIRKSKLGNLNVTKYSFVLDSELVINMIKHNILNMVRREYLDKVHLMSENKNNYYVVNRIGF